LISSRLNQETSHRQKSVINRMLKAIPAVCDKRIQYSPLFVACRPNVPVPDGERQIVERHLRDFWVHLQTPLPFTRQRANSRKTSTEATNVTGKISRSAIRYARTLALELPVGAGLIESGLRHARQARIKQSGA
jgi:hypothetical protein